MFPKRLNKLSLAKSVVGRAVILVGGVKCLPLNFPLIILITNDFKKNIHSANTEWTNL